MFIIDDILKLAASKDASDIFITVGVPPTMKIHGAFERIGDISLSPQEAEKLVKNLFKREEHFREFLAVGEKDFSISINGVGRFRVDAYTQRGSMAAAIRILKFDRPNPQLLRIPSQVLDFYNKNKGLILVTGPTGSGKSTTLTSIIDLINKNMEKHIITLEDPIEFLHRHDKSIIDQREIGLDTKSYSFALRSAMRQAPDVILVGEMRDHETTSIAITAAETGHLVLSSMHTVGASKTIDRIIDMFPANQQQQIRVQLSTVLSAVVSQQLIPSEKYGRVAAFEIMIVNPAIRNLIRDNKISQIDGVIQTSKSQGMITMDSNILDLYNEGLISKDDAYKFCTNTEVLARYL
jgi:twitching motility protein PilT